MVVCKENFPLVQNIYINDSILLRVEIPWRKNSDSLVTENIYYEGIGRGLFRFYVSVAESGYVPPFGGAIKNSAGAGLDN